MEKVSIIITCYNYGSYLEKCIDSILRQLYQNKEIIVVNDGSTDNTKKVIRSFKNKIRTISNSSPQGCGIARNQGLELAQGSLCLFVDADDYLDPKYLQVTVPKLIESKAGVVYSDFYQVFLNQSRKLWQSLPFQREKLLSGNFIPITSLTRTNLVRSVGGFDNNILLQDYDIWLRITHVSSAVRVNQPLFYYVIHKNNMNQTMSDKKREYDCYKIKKRIKYGIFLFSNEKIYLITGKRIKHLIPKNLLLEVGLDNNDIFPVDSNILGQYQSGEPIDSLQKLLQITASENRW